MYIHEFLNIQAGHHHRPEEEDSGEIWSALAASSSLISNSSLRDFTVLLRAHNYTSNVAESWEECAVTSTSTWTWTWSSETVCTCEKVYLVEVVCMPSWFLAGKKKTEEPDYQQLTCTLKFENNSDGTFCIDDSRNLLLRLVLTCNYISTFTYQMIFWGISRDRKLLRLVMMHSHGSIFWDICKTFILLRAIVLKCRLLNSVNMVKRV